MDVRHMSVTEVIPDWLMLAAVLATIGAVIYGARIRHDLQFGWIAAPMLWFVWLYVSLLLDAEPTNSNLELRILLHRIGELGVFAAVTLYSVNGDLKCQIEGLLGRITKALKWHQKT